MSTIDTQDQRNIVVDERGRESSAPNPNDDKVQTEARLLSERSMAKLWKLGYVEAPSPEAVQGYIESQGFYLQKHLPKGDEVQFYVGKGDGKKIGIKIRKVPASPEQSDTQETMKVYSRVSKRRKWRGGGTWKLHEVPDVVSGLTEAADIRPERLESYCLEQRPTRRSKSPWAHRDAGAHNAVRTHETHQDVLEAAKVQHEPPSIRPYSEKDQWNVIAHSAAVRFIQHVVANPDTDPEDAFRRVFDTGSIDALNESGIVLALINLCGEMRSSLAPEQFQRLDMIKSAAVTQFCMR